MDAMKGLGDLAERLTYELIGLVIPAGVLVFGAAAAAGVLGSLVQLAGDHPWLLLAALYVLGYPLQAVSSLVTKPFAALGQRVLRRTGGGRRGGPDLWALAAAKWQKALALDVDSALRRDQLVNLSFSVIAEDRRQLDRFRAAASATRGSAAAVFFAAVAHLALVAAGSGGPLTISPWVIWSAAVVIFGGLVERAEMYDALWSEIVAAQYLASGVAGSARSEPREPQ